VAGSGGGAGTRSVASYDEDTTTMAVEAGRLVLGQSRDFAPASVLFSTTNPAYSDRTNATAIHAALRLAPDVRALDLNGASRSAVGALHLALASMEPSLVLSSDIRLGLPGGADESAGGDGAAALLVGTSGDGDLIAELVGEAACTDEFVDRWRTPGEPASRLWEERFGEG
jgi:hydroxymethylglutaryl-CoA synthase